IEFAGLHMRGKLVRLAIVLLAAALACGNARAQDLLSQEWLLDPALSTVYMQTVKANSTFETHQFTVVEGSISSSGDASVRIDLGSIRSGIDIRDTRMRFQLFETFKFPNAQVNAKLDKAKLRALSSQTRINYPLSLSLSL